MDMLLMRIRKGVTVRSGNEQNGLNMLWMRARSGVTIRKGDPVAMLRPGSAYVLRGGRPVESAALLAPGDSIDLLLSDGTARCLVDSVRSDKCGGN